MKKIVYSLAILALAACAKEVQKEEVVPQDGNKVTTIIATVDPGTRTTLDIVGNVGEYSWEDSETISVFNGDVALPFTVVETANGTFQYTGEASTDNLAYAVSPEGALSDPTTDGYKLTLKSEYTGYKANVSNALMVAGAPENGEGGIKKFTFDHAAALMRFTFENVPAGTSKLVFSTTDKNINGTYTVTTTEPELTQADANGSTSTTLTLAEPTSVVSDLVFYVPIPTGDYTDFTVALYKGDDEVVTKTMRKKTEKTKLFTAAKGNIVNTPVITLQVSSSATYTRIISKDDLSNGDYLIVCESANVALDGSLTTIDATSNTVPISHTDGVIQGSAELDASAFTITAVTNGYTIKSKSGLFIGHTGSSNSLNSTTNENSAYVSTISFSGNNANIQCGTNYNLRYNSSSGQTRFRYFSSTQTAVQLYKKNSAQLSVPQGLSVEGMTVSWYKVAGAASYVLTVGEEDYEVLQPDSGNKVSKELNIAADYYSVSVIAKASGYKDSNPATLTDAKFGTPTIEKPALVQGTITTTSVQVTWTDDANSTNGYHCEIYQGPSKVNETDVELGIQSVTFSNLTINTAYEVRVNGNAVTGDKPYAASDVAKIAVTTLSSDKTYYVKVSAITSGKQYILVDNTYSMIFNSASPTQPSAGIDASSLITSERIESNATTDSYSVTITSDGTKYKVLLSNEQYLFINQSTSNNGQIGSNETGESITITKEEDGFEFISGNRPARALVYRSGYNFRNYATANIGTSGYGGYFDLYELSK